MQQGTTVFDLKGQARRLRTALSEQQTPVTHAAALNLIARAQGARNWEALEASLNAQHEAERASLTAAQQFPDQQARSTEHWLNWLEAALRMRDVTEVDLDDMVHGCLSPEEASLVNNEGMLSQLEALLTWHTEPHVRNPREHLVKQLEDVIDELELPMPESTKGNERFGFGIYARVNVCSGSQFERELRLDCLEWFANQAPKDISRLVVDGLHNSSLSDEVALWLEEHSLNTTARQELHEMLEYMRNTLKADQRPVSNVVGVTVDIDEASVVAFLDSQMEAGVEFSAAALEKLAMRARR